MRDGKTLAEIDERLSFQLRKKRPRRLFEYMAELFPPECYGEEGDAIVAHLRALKRRKGSLQPTPSAATVIPLRPTEAPC
jgi:hypothetical protein